MPEGSVVTSAQPSENRIVSADSARSMRSMLRQVVLSGTGKKAQLNGYTTAGKTGTAWKFDPVAKRVDPSKYIASFIGFAPADDPEVVIAVVVDEPKGPHDGGGAAAPIFRDIAAQILPELGVKPDGKLVADTQVANDITEEPGAADVPDKGEKRDNTAPKEDKKTAGTSSPRSARPAKPAKDDDKGKRGNSDAPKAGKLTAYLETIYGSPPISVLLET